MHRVCGIGGIVGTSGVSQEALDRMALAMAHRGPDGQGTWNGDGCGLAFRRLAIIDLDQRSDQPLHLDALHLVFNGEIYNYVELREDLRRLGHRFVTEGDGEVLLHAWAEWGEAALDRLNGMFAFAVWNDRERSLTLASDPFGEKPVYLLADSGTVLFASDVRAIAAAREATPTPNEDVLAAYLARGLMAPLDGSFLRGVRRIPGAHIVRVHDGRITWRRYWTPAPATAPRRYEDAVEELRDLLRDSIRLRLRADVPVGTSLSGGVDSSAIVALSASLAGDHRRHAFTAAFAGYDRDEWRYAHAVAQAAGVIEHHRIAPTLEELQEDVGALVRDQEEPFGSLSAYAQWRVNRAAREAGVTVLLDGQGADELFVGYDRTVGFALRELGVGAIARGMAQPRLRMPLAVALANGLPDPILRRLRARVTSPYVAAELATAGLDRVVVAPAARENGPLRRELLRQQFATNLPELLRYADRDSMAHSREVRLPFLDRRIAEFALGLPAAFLYRDGTTKAILRDAVRGAVPDIVLDRREKVGFEPPQATWLNSSAGRRWVTEILLDPGARVREHCDTTAIERDARAGRWRDHGAVWRAVNAELWLQWIHDRAAMAPAAA